MLFLLFSSSYISVCSCIGQQNNTSPLSSKESFAHSTCKHPCLERHGRLTLVAIAQESMTWPLTYARSLGICMADELPAQK